MAPTSNPYFVKDYINRDDFYRNMGTAELAVRDFQRRVTWVAKKSMAYFALMKSGRMHGKRLPAYGTISLMRRE
ncbi:MAG TPA: hypothetical protein DCP92_15735 [Nitrospiraceae bacterium]|jgi:hypothetical protein|nr:hypothetical protein [Nitrospiraceae bacterium]